MQFDQPYANHKGGQVLFGNDGFLYISTGDGGSGGDPENHGQSKSTFLGKILRIDVDHQDSGLNYSIPQGNPFKNNTDNWNEAIWVYGMRNPWRMSFDRPTGRLWTGDVGQGLWEEVDIIEGGKNYGWRVMEGNHCYGQSTCDSTGLQPPLVEYDHSIGQSVTGGYVYRGSNCPELQGKYVYGDYGSSKFWKLSYDESNPYVNSNEFLTDSQLWPSAFGVDQNNELYILAYKEGRIYKFNNQTASVLPPSVSVSATALHSCTLIAALCALLFLVF